MISLDRIGRDYRECGALNTHVNVHAALDDHTFLTKSGDVFSVLRVAGVDSEGLDAPQLEDVCRRFETFLKPFNEAFRIYQYLVKREVTDLPCQLYPESPVVNEAIISRRDFLKRQAKPLYTVELFFAIVYEDAARRHSRALAAATEAPLSWLRRQFSTAARIAAVDDEIRRKQSVLSDKVHGFIVQLQDTLRPSLLNKNDAFRFIRGLLNYAPHQRDVHLKYDQFVDYQACGSALECYRDHLRLGDHYVQVLTLKEPPSRTVAHLWRELHDLPSNYVIVSEWKEANQAAVRRLIRSKRRHFHNSKASLLNYLNSSQVPTQNVLIDDSAAALTQELGTCLEELEVRGNSFGEYSLTIVLYDQDLAHLKRSIAECCKALSAYDAQVLEERFDLLNAFLAVLPANHFFNLRRMWMLRSNYADLSFLFTVHSGEARNNHLGAEYLAVLETAHGTPYFFNLHYQDVAHSLIMGATGSGKSFLLNFLITNLQKYQPFTLIFDLGGSYENLTRLFNGRYLPVGTNQHPVRINPFCLPATADNFRFLLAFVRVLIESNGYVMTAGDETDVYEQIRNVYEVEIPQRRLFTLANVLHRRLREQLQDWIQGGPWAGWFDHAEDNLTFARFQTIDFEGMDKAPRALEALLFYLLHRASTSILDESPTTFKVFVMDESWRFLRHPVIKSYITEALKTWRKKNAAVLLATQSSSDLLQSDMLSVVAESCPTKIFLANPGGDREEYRRVFHLTETESALVARLLPKQQLLLKRPDRTKVLNLHVDPKGYWLYTDHPDHNEKKRAAFEQYGFEQGLEILTRSHPT